VARSKDRARKERRPPSRVGERAITPEVSEPEVAGPEAVPPSRTRTWVVRAVAVTVALCATLTVFHLRSTASQSLVFPAPGEIRLFDTDPYYHFRHGRYAAEHFPHLLRWDPGIYPAGTPSLYVGLFDLGMGAAAVILGGSHPDLAVMERVAAWTPPVLAAVGVLALFWLAWVTVGPLIAALACIFFVLDPGLSASRGLLGYPDHHIAEIFLGLATIAGLTQVLQRSRAPRPPPWYRPAILGALPLSLFIFTWLGAPIYLVLIGVSLFLVVTVEIARGAGGGDVSTATTRYGLGALLVLVPVALLVPWMPLNPHIFRQTLVAIVLLAGGMPLYVHVLGALIRRGLPTWAAALAGVAGVALVVAGLYFIVPDGKLLAAELLEVKTELVREQAPVTLRGYFYLGSGPAGFAFLALPLVLIDAARGRDRRFALAPIMVGALVVALWLRTHDYGYAAPGYLALLAAFVTARLLELARRRWLQALIALVLAASVAVPLYFEWVVPPQRGADNLKGLMILDEGWVHALRWVRDHTPKLQIGPATTIPPDHHFRHPPGDYGVLAFWDFGHFIAAIAERAPFAAGGISGGLASWFLIEDEEQAIKPDALGMQEGEHARYVMVDARTAADFFMAGLKMADRALEDFKQPLQRYDVHGTPMMLWTFGDRYKKTMIGRLYLGEGREVSHYRLLYQSPERSALFFDAKPTLNGTEVTRRSMMFDGKLDSMWMKLAKNGKPVNNGPGALYDVSIAPTVKVYEEVAGAVLDGYAEPGATVVASLDLVDRVGDRPVHYTRTGTADAQGRYLLRVPYPTDEGGDTNVRPTGPYELKSGDKVLGKVAVASDAVASGARVLVPAGP
jgi:dolichyl-diphosphooligosaccharide--protein glycosyltransferase